MNKKEEIILEFMKDPEYKPMKAKEIAIILGVPKKEYPKFQEAIAELEKEFKIGKNHKNKYKVIKEEYKEGNFRKNAKGFGFVNIGEEDEIYISKENTNNALNGDIVLVEILEEKNKLKKAEGKIKKIIKHEKDTIVGTFQNNRNFGFVVPDDKNFGTDIFISKSNFGKARNGHKVLVEITKYPKNDKKAEGKIIEILGKPNEAGVDMLSLIKEYRLPSRFPEPVVKEAQKFGDKIEEKEIQKRIDNRKDIIFTIDGEDAKDLDDAVRVTKMENGNYRLDVHIADVSHYVKENSLLDNEALIRGTSIYMLGRVIPMLPRELSNVLCSLNAGQDRFTLSCSMEINKEGKVVSSEVYKGIINVKERMNYHDVQKILDKSDTDVLERYKPYIKDFETMAELATILKNRRMEQGYLNLDIPESKIDLDINGKVINIGKYETSFSNEIIEQFMLIANETIAEKFYWLQAPFIYRVHEDPDIDKVKELNKFLFNFGMNIKISNEKVYPTEFSKILEQIKGKEEEKVVSNLILRTLKVAKYESENKGHFGIASKYYCHFTSPIRRYPDLFIHRIISKYLDNNYDVPEKWIEDYMQKAEDRARESSEREKIATKVERESEDLKKAEYMEGKIGEEYEGIVSSVTQFGIFVELPNTVEGLIRFDDLGDEYFIYDENRKRLIGERTNKTYQIGDKVKIRVKSASKMLRQIDFEVFSGADSKNTQKN
ncbi:MAG: ribonuclease R [Clostridium sp. 27_14]|nr:MAG: ribonuclease R [Clostridium sp. 27_14]